MREALKERETLMNENMPIAYINFYLKMTLENDEQMAIACNFASVTPASMTPIDVIAALVCCLCAQDRGVTPKEYDIISKDIYEDMSKTLPPENVHTIEYHPDGTTSFITHSAGIA